jgi:hypothetical protein
MTLADKLIRKFAHNYGIRGNIGSKVRRKQKNFHTLLIELKLQMLLKGPFIEI